MRPNLGILFAILVIASCRPQQIAVQPDVPAVSDSAQVHYSPWVNYRAAPSRHFDLIHTKLDLQFNWEERKVLGKATLTLSPYFYEQRELVLDAKSFEINSVSWISDDSIAALPYLYEEDELVLLFPETLAREDTVIVSIVYVANPYVGSSPENRGLFFINHDGSHPNKPRQIWTQGETEYNSRWFPTIDRPNERCTQETLITVSRNFQTISNGRLVSSLQSQDGTRTDYWRMDQPHAPYLFMVAVGEFDKVSDSAEGIPLNYYVEGNSNLAKDIFGHTPEMMSYFSGLLDVPYPWPKYDQIVVRDFVSGAMENTTASVFMEDLMTPRLDLADDNWDGIISHELFHQWFGNLVTCESWSNLPLNEALASYGEHLWIEYKYGPEEAAFHSIIEIDAYLEEASETKEDLIRFYYDDAEEMFDSHSYAKGARIMHMLRLYVGDEAFFASLTHYLKGNRFKSVEVHDLRRSFEQVTGEDLNWFFIQWFLNAGHPEILATHRYESDTLYIALSQEQDLSQYPLYYLPLSLDLIFEDSVKRYPFPVVEQEHTFKVPLSVRPKGVIIDGDYQLVGVLDHEKSEAELFAQVGAGHSFSARYEGLLRLLSSDDLQTRDKAIQLGLEDPSRHIVEMTLSLLAYSDPEGIHRYATKVISLLQSPFIRIRGAALIALEGTGLLHREDWLDQLRDSTYYVKGIALEHLIYEDDPASDSLFQAYRSYDNINIILPLARYVNDQEDGQRLSWYLERLQAVRSSDVYFVLQSLNEYLLQAGEEEQRLAVEVLSDYAFNFHNYLGRLTAFQGLLMLENVPGVKGIIEEIKASENNVELRQILLQY